MKHFGITPKLVQRRGSTLIMAIIFLLAVSVLVISIFDRSTQNISTTSRRINDPVTTTIAESGIEKAVWCLNNLTATATECPKDAQGKYVGETDVVLGRGSYTSSVSASGQTATITVTATTAGLGGGSVKQVQATLVQAASLNPSFQFGVQTGEGGIVMSNNASVIGNAYTNGSITGSNGSSVTGDAILAVSSPVTDGISDAAVSPLLTKNVGDAANTIYLAQQFVSGVNDSVYSIDFKLAKHGVGPPGLTAYIYTDDAGIPGTNISGSGQDLNAAFPYDSPGGWENGWTNQIFNPGSVLLQGTSYWLVLKSASSNSAKYWTTVRSADDTTYSTGTAKVGSGLTGTCPAAGSVCPLNYDIAFRLKMGGQYPTLDVPTVGGNAFSHIIKDTTIGQHAYYQSLDGTVKANGGAATCSLTSSTYCHANSVDQPPQNFPISDAEIAQMEAIAAAGGVTTCSPTCTLTDGTTVGPRKYVGDVSIEGGATVTLGGTIWVQGNFTLDNNVILQLDPAYGTNNGIIIADDTADIVNGGRIIFSNNGDLRGSANASCTGTPKRCSDGLNKNNNCSVAADCPMNAIMAISKNADPAQVISAIEVSNNLSAGVLYAPYGLVSIKNNASLKEVTAQKLSLAPNTSIKYMTGLASAIFTSGPGASWQLQPGSYRIVD